MKLLAGTIYVKSVTASDDLPFQVEQDGSEEGQTILSSINIHCYTNDAYYGNTAFQQGIIRANAVVWFDGAIRVSDLRFKNYTAGSNTTIVVTGIVR
jgi:hypothetical protein